MTTVINTDVHACQTQTTMHPSALNEMPWPNTINRALSQVRGRTLLEDLVKVTKLVHRVPRGLLSKEKKRTNRDQSDYDLETIQVCSASVNIVFLPFVSCVR